MPQLIYSCDLFKNERDILESTVEDIINREGLTLISDVNLKTLNAVIDDDSKQAQNEILSAPSAC